MDFISAKHKLDWAEALQAARAVRQDGSIKADFGASLYILTGLPDVYERAKSAIEPGMIDFYKILEKGLSKGERILVSLAGNLYNGGFFAEYTPLDLVASLDADRLALAVAALALRKKNLNISDAGFTLKIFSPKNI